MEEKKIGKVVELRKSGSSQVVAKATVKKKFSQTVIAVRAICFWIIILSTVVLALVGVASIWTGEDEIFWKSFSTFLVVSAAAGFVSLIAPLLDKTDK